MKPLLLQKGDNGLFQGLLTAEGEDILLQPLHNSRKELLQPRFSPLFLLLFLQGQVDLHLPRLGQNREDRVLQTGDQIGDPLLHRRLTQADGFQCLCQESVTGEGSQEWEKVVLHHGLHLRGRARQEGELRLACVDPLSGRGSKGIL